jgi:hypothetical protein
MPRIHMTFAATDHDDWVRAGGSVSAWNSVSFVNISRSSRESRNSSHLLVHEISTRRDAGLRERVPVHDQEVEVRRRLAKHLSEVEHLRDVRMITAPSSARPHSLPSNPAST